jgi:hypothetical protein
MINKKSKKAMGRPKIGTQNVKGIYFAARFTKAETQQINEAVRRSGLSKSDFIRNRLLAS